MKKLLFITLLLTIIFIPKNIYAQEEWINTEEGTYYLIDGNPVTGIYEIDGEKYYFDENGKQVTGFIKIDGKNYFFSRTYGYALKGWVYNFEGKWYEQEDGSLLTGYQTIDGKNYYFDENGMLQTGFININGKPYFFSRTYEYTLEGWVSNFEGKWYEQPDGSLLTGYQTIDGKHYYFDENGMLQTGFININGKPYFFSRTYEYALEGWVSNFEGKWYEQPDGSLLTGINNIDGKNYYFDENGMLQTGFININGKPYFFSRTYEYALEGWVSNFEGKWYEQPDGSLLTGINTIDGKNYYFDENGMLQTGFININGKPYFFSRTYEYALEGWVSNFEGKWYEQEDGSLLTGYQTIDGKNYYFDENGMLQTGFIDIDGKTYFFSRTYGYTLKGFIKNHEGAWYEQEDGSLLTGNGLTVIDNKEYYLDYKFFKSGIIEIDGKKYYFDDETYDKQYKTVEKEYYTVYIDEETFEVIKKQYKPVYYMQKDARWNKQKFGIGLFGMTGCAPTGMAMAFTSILQREILPPEVGSYLYKNTDQFNKRLKGTSGMGIIYASEYYDVKVSGISSKKELIDALKQGKIVYASMQNGKFAKPTYNHVIIMYDYNEETEETFVHDPLTNSNNEWTDVDLIWREQCMDPDDRTGGYAIYSLEEK